MNVNQFNGSNKSIKATTATHSMKNDAQIPSTMDQSKVLERQVTSRMQRLAAEKRNARRSRAIAKKK